MQISEITKMYWEWNGGQFQVLEIVFCEQSEKYALTIMLVGQMSC